VSNRALHVFSLIASYSVALFLGLLASTLVPHGSTRELMALAKLFDHSIPRNQSFMKAPDSIASIDGLVDMKKLIREAPGSRDFQIQVWTMTSTAPNPFLLSGSGGTKATQSAPPQASWALGEDAIESPRSIVRPSERLWHPIMDSNRTQVFAILEITRHYENSWSYLASSGIGKIFLFFILVALIRSGWKLLEKTVFAIDPTSPVSLAVPSTAFVLLSAISSVLLFATIRSHLESRYVSNFIEGIHPASLHPLETISVDRSGLSEKWIIEHSTLSGMVPALSGSFLAMLWIVLLIRSFRIRTSQRNLSDEVVANQRLTIEKLEVQLEEAEVYTWTIGDSDEIGMVEPRLLSRIGISPAGPQRFDSVDWKTLCHPEDLSQLESSVRDIATGSTVRFEREVRLRSSLGIWQWFSWRGRRLNHFDGKSQAPQIAGVIVDIDKIRQLQSQIELVNSESHAKLEALNRFAILAITDNRGIITWVNDKFCDISGFRRDELLGRSHKIVNSKTHPPEFFEGLWTTISSGRTWKGEICNRSKSGRLYWVDSIILPLKDASGDITGYFSVREDITPRKVFEAGSEPKPPSVLVGAISIDWNELDRRMLGNSELRQKVLSLSLAQLDQKSQEIQTLAIEKRPEVAAAIHSLKGICLNIEARECVSILLAMEDRSCESDAVRNLTSDLEKAIHRLKAEIQDRSG
jgi:PAS domain S-box-containing protein